MHVKQNNNNTAKERILHERCNCSSRVAFGIQCRHEICAKGGTFLKDTFDPRWYHNPMNQYHVEQNGKFPFHTIETNIHYNLTYVRCFAPISIS